MPGEAVQSQLLSVFLGIEEELVKVEEKDITNKILLEIANHRRKELEAYEPQELKPLNDTPPDRQATVRKPIKSGNRHAKKQESNLREAPNKEYTKTPNRFFEAIYEQYLRPYETKVLFFLVRKTWCWQKLSEFIPLKEFEKIGIPKDKASRALSSLAKRRIVVQLGNKRYAIQSDTNLWKDRPKKKRRQSKRAKTGVA